MIQPTLFDIPPAKPPKRKPKSAPRVEPTTETSTEQMLRFRREAKEERERLRMEGKL